DVYWLAMWYSDSEPKLIQLRLTSWALLQRLEHGRQAVSPQPEELPWGLSLLKTLPPNLNLNHSLTPDMPARRA
ncbi:hypothetical protein NQZ68_000672, partial [Dissostichus eleginoides]